jgi:prophage tail gpP-like protein
VPGWRQDNGALWLPNLLVLVRDHVIGFDREMLIVETAWIMDAEGLRTDLTVGLPDGYRSKAAKAAGKKKSKSKGKSGSDPDWSDIK